MKRQFINIVSKDANRPIFRIVSCERFVQMLRGRENSLVLPKLWDDPFENFILKGFVRTPDGKLAKMRFHDQLYGQCWSLHREAAFMWRVYSPKKNAVKLRTTIRTLYDSVYAAGGQYRDISCFIGKVQYFKKRRIAEELDRVSVVDPSGVAVAATLLVKRWAFRPEREVRLIYFSQERNPADIFTYRIDPNALFAEAILDPRMNTLQAERWKTRLQEAGFSNRIVQSGLYKPPDSVVLKI